jgi:hypothetical protein
VSLLRLVDLKMMRPNVSVPPQLYADAICSLVDSGLLSLAERNNLVGMGHSGGSGAM